MQQEPLHALAHNPTETRTQRLVRTFQGITQKDGWKGLNVPGVAAYFYTIHELRWLVAVWQIPWLSVEGAMHAEHAEAGSTLAKLSTPGNLATGAFARVSIGFVLNPITVVKSRFESSNFARDAYPTVRSSLRSIYRDAGFRGFFRGYSATALRDAPYAGLYLAFYEHGKHLLSRLVLDGTAQVNSGKWWVVGTSSILAGTLATIVTQPFDIIKTRMQTTPTNILEQEALKRRKSATALAVARHVLKTNGIGAFADGLGLRCARKAASSMIGWSIFELGNRWAVQGATRK
ncbi:hypothetical protein MVES_003508 [Malassezia vespertilionis]|uniref:Solute carrier family 25 member 38 homolog n=1 Tax=Malassezia vespertilionis TaxID=2020962 RepID=A0A2N1J803_9BASI|nr:hypothetical protein MVES_003508 [Malassezia vespertilionis]